MLIAGNTGTTPMCCGSTPTAASKRPSARKDARSSIPAATRRPPPLAVMPDGKIVVGTGAFSAARLTADGFADPTFDGEDGVFTTDLTPVIGNYESTGAHWH